jgi:hypothetical protein
VSLGGQPSPRVAVGLMGSTIWQQQKQENVLIHWIALDEVAPVRL